MPLIDARNITYAPDGVPVLTDVTLRSDARRIGIVGRNGSGKTSLARVLAGLIVPDSGEVRIAGAAVGTERKAALSAVGILFQNPDHQIIFPTVEEEIAFGLGQMGLAEAEVRAGVQAVLDRFGKTHWAKAAIHRLSQGQRQLVCLMSVLAMRPQVILLDEPFAGLDIPTSMHLSRVLADVDAALIQITHDPAMVAGYDHVLWLDGGTVTAQGAPQEVLSAFEARMTELGAGDDLSDLAG
ncbi:Biotin transport ATP-binding protein BioM [Sulfitobacter sp. THAF37]|uniref:energy-coupling factor ABC transporter ATP-binding protein n=1 Tax=Sulfitobacter sp. THAF37 TaxID=2587855 RepID=UPI00126841F6|nr:ABC transporter ATP-binding protein [Sulfitobacter sp. THAF37]QFT58677.1 Biotin transport ATP-binding protein BioM [Sulfitobacter sp. THAF37]